MKWFVIAVCIAAAYVFMMTQTANIMLSQTQNLQKQYTYVANHADDIAAGKTTFNATTNH